MRGGFPSSKTPQIALPVLRIGISMVKICGSKGFQNVCYLRHPTVGDHCKSCGARVTTHYTRTRGAVSGLMVRDTSKRTKFRALMAITRQFRVEMTIRRPQNTYFLLMTFDPLELVQKNFQFFFLQNLFFFFTT